jgi:hypothetical protein
MDQSSAVTNKTVNIAENIGATEVYLFKIKSLKKCLTNY